MKEYVLSVVLTAVAVSVLCAIAPGDRRGVRFIAELCLLFVLFTPIFNMNFDFEILDTEANQSEFDGIFEGALDKISRENVEESVGRILEEQFGVLSGDYAVYAEISRGETVECKKISIVLTGSAVWNNPREIAKAVESAFGCECEITVG